MTNLKFEGIAETPSKIVCIGRNFVGHIQELGNEVTDTMVVFNKPFSALSRQLSSFNEEPLHYEGEISFLIKDRSFAAVAFGLDITKRKLQSKLRAQGLPWERAKAFDGAAVFSPFVPTPKSLDSLSLKLDINGVTHQEGGVELMIYKPNEILDELTRFTTLNDGDIVMTGTPKGTGTINSNDLFCGTIFDKNKPLVSATWRAI